MFTWIAVLVASIIVYLAVARQTGFRILTSSNGESRFGSLKGILSTSDNKGEGGFGSAIWKKAYADKDDDGKKLALYIIAILVAYAAAHIAPDGKEIVYRGVAALIVLHFIWTFSPGKAGKMTWFIVGGMLAYFVLAWAYPKDAPRALDAGWGLSKKVMASIASSLESANANYNNASAAGGGESQKEEGMWMLFDPDVYTLARPGDRESIFIDDPETWVQLPEVPDGFEAEVACGSASMKIYWKGGPRYGQEVVCKGLVLRDLEKLTITVSPITEDGEVISVRLKPIKKA